MCLFFLIFTAEPPATSDRRAHQALRHDSRGVYRRSRRDERLGLDHQRVHRRRHWTRERPGRRARGVLQGPLFHLPLNVETPTDPADEQEQGRPVTDVKMLRIDELAELGCCCFWSVPILAHDLLFPC